jgi:hypothetical protein
VPTAFAYEITSTMKVEVMYEMKAVTNKRIKLKTGPKKANY